MVFKQKNVNVEVFKDMVAAHENFLKDGSTGARLNFVGGLIVEFVGKNDFSSAIIKDSRFENSVFDSSDFSQSEIVNTYIYKSSVNKTNFFTSKWEESIGMKSDFKKAYFDCSTISNCTFRFGDFSKASFEGSTIRNTSFIKCDFTFTSFENVKFENVRFISCSFNGTNFKGSTGLSSPIDIIAGNYEKTENGYIGYCAFDKAPEPGQIFTETVNTNRSTPSGIHVMTKEYIDWIYKDKETGNDKRTRYKKVEIWEVIIPFEYLSGVVTPFDFHGEIYCERVKVTKFVRNSYRIAYKSEV